MLSTSHKDLFVVYQFDEKIRFGNESDGGYVMCSLGDIYDCYISAGVSNEESFTRDFIEHYNIKKDHCFGFDGTIDNYPYSFTKNINFIKKNISNVNDDNNTNIHDILTRYKNIFIKMDIEGYEYRWINSLTNEMLNNIKQLVIEFHGVLDNSWNTHLDEKISAWKKLNTTHYITHAHGNNYSDSFEGIPKTLEFTYINKCMFDCEPPLNTTNLPIKSFDYPNNYQCSDFDLSFPPFVHSQI